MIKNNIILGISFILVLLLSSLVIPIDEIFATTFVNSFSVAAQDGFPKGIAFSNDGSKMFVVGSNSKSVHQYTLSSPFDISTAAYVDSFSVAAQINSPHGIAFSNDGSKMFVVGTNNYITHIVSEYTLSSPFDISTAAFTNSFSVAAHSVFPRDIAFSNNGSKMFVARYDNKINEYTLSSPFDVSTAAFTNSFSVAAQINSLRDVAFSNDGSKMFVVGSFNDKVHQYTLSSSFDVSTAAFTDSFSVTTVDNNLRGLAFSNDGSKMFVVGGYIAKVNEYTLKVPFDLFASAPTSPPTVTYVDSFSVAAQDSYPTGIAFSNDGFRMFVVGSISKAVNQYTLSSPFDVSTAAYVDSFSVRTQGKYPHGLAFSNDGSKMFVVGTSNDKINQYTLSSPFDISTAAFTNSFSVVDGNSQPMGLAFSNDGSKMFVTEYDDKINQYTLSSPFNISTASFTNSFSVASQDSYPSGLAFSNDGSKMFVLDRISPKVNQYTLSSPFNISTAAFTNSFSVAAQDSLPSGIAFSNDGLKMFVAGGYIGKVNEYELKVPFDLFAPSPPASASPTSPNMYENECDSDCIPPTLGIDEYGYRIVTNGFSYNGQSVDVEQYFTPYPLVTAQIGKQNVAEFKIYDNLGPDNISHFEFAFGLGNGESIGVSKAVINWDRTIEGIQTFNTDDPEDAFSNVLVTTFEDDCSDELQQKCLVIKILHTFRTPLDFNILATNVWDSKRNGWQNYYNDGVEIVGKSLNTLKEYDGVYKGYIYHLTETSNTSAVDGFGNSWSLKYDKWERDHIPNKKPTDGLTMHGYNRNNSNFEEYKYEQQLLAQKELKKMCPKCFDESYDKINDIFAYDYDS